MKRRLLRKATIAYLGVCLGVCLGVGLGVGLTADFTVWALQAAEEPRVRLGGKTFTVAVADTDETRQRGLSGSAPLPADRGMLFVFERDGRHPIWMKEMRFALDIVWINRFGAVVHIEYRVHPDTYPRSFASRKPAKYVLEIPAGAGESVSVGDPVHFENVSLR